MMQLIALGLSYAKEFTCLRLSVPFFILPWSGGHELKFITSACTLLFRLQREKVERVDMSVPQGRALQWGYMWPLGSGTQCYCSLFITLNIKKMGEVVRWRKLRPYNQCVLGEQHSLDACYLNSDFVLPSYGDMLKLHVVCEMYVECVS